MVCHFHNFLFLVRSEKCTIGQWNGHKDAENSKSVGESNQNKNKLKQTKYLSF
jgi:hypothetical protein